jgi:hypothetical protein
MLFWFFGHGGEELEYIIRQDVLLVDAARGHAVYCGLIVNAVIVNVKS